MSTNTEIIARVCPTSLMGAKGRILENAEFQARFHEGHILTIQRYFDSHRPDQSVCMSGQCSCGIDLIMVYPPNLELVADGGN